jgi:histidine ammonia-lyase
MHRISPEYLSIREIKRIIDTDEKIELSQESVGRIEKCRTYLESKINETDALYYGINTGFGSLCNIKIPPAELSQLQENLVRSHACGVGDVVPAEIIKLMFLLKIQSLAYGHSGVRLETVERLVYFYNNNILPIVYQKGSLGASGDLAPLAHLSLPLLGEGEVYMDGKRVKAAEMYAGHKGIEPLKLEAKEGLALLNGTQFMSAYGCWCIMQAEKLSLWADVTASLSIDGWFCRTEPFLPYIHDIRPHNGQKNTASRILKILEGSAIADHPKQQVQDPYSFRCIPQVHGASADAIDYCKQVVEREVNSVTDNPNIFPDEDLIVSGGNFHGQPLALVLDFLKIALAELGNISERRTFNLISGVRNLPGFLVAAPGLNSGLMIPQYTAAALVSDNKQNATPASVDSITSSNGQEDHVSMGANGAVQLYRVVRNLQDILAIEWLSAAQAMHFRRPLETSPLLEQLLEKYRETVPFIEQDRILHDDIVKTAEFMAETEISI